MLWMGFAEMFCVAMLAGILGGVLMAIATRQNNKYNMEMMELQWKSDYSYFRERIEKLEHQISTLSVDKPVSNGKNLNSHKGYKHQRHNYQRG